jgi:steroid delta-isomerase-like uncharacterized protein
MKQSTIHLTAALFLSTAAISCDSDKGKDKPSPTAQADKGKVTPTDKPKDEGEKAPQMEPTAIAITSIEAFNQGKYDDALANFADSATYKTVGDDTQTQTSKAGIKKMWEEMKTAFPDMKMQPTRIIEIGETVYIHGVATGTHKGELAGQPPTDKPIGQEMLFVAEMKDVKVTQMTEYSNSMAVMAQTGAIKGMEVPVPEAFAGKPETIKGSPNSGNVEVVKKMYAVFSEDPEKALKEAEQWAHPDATMHEVPFGKTTKGVEEGKKEMAKMKKVFANTKVDTKSIESAGDWVIATGVWKGKHIGKSTEFPFPATNKEFAIDFIEVHKLEGGKIKESWSYSNPMQMMKQLELLPEKEDKAVANK